MISLTLPPKFKDILINNDLNKALFHTLSLCEEVYKLNRLEFFPEYTDHGIEHIEGVLNSAYNIIHEDTLGEFSEKDVLVLSLSILMHDIGMHITSDGLLRLINGEYDDVRVQQFNDKTWKQEWEEFGNEISRLNSKQLKNIFGKSISVKPPKLGVINLSTYDKLYCGEFIRRNHGRLAHEICIKGFPGIDCNIDILNVNASMRNLIGLAARSHTINIRETFEFLKYNYDDTWKFPLDVKIIYIMIVLRIADYIQISPNRALKFVIKTKKFGSPISVKEFDLNQCVEDISDKIDDSESIFIKATPPNSEIYLKFEELIKNLQQELDLSWAIIGEVYSMNKDFKHYKIKYRRIKASIDDKKKFSTLINYVPRKVFFNVDPEILKLLISPLYADNPSYGVRELLQNSIDACHERYRVLTESPETHYIPQIDIQIILNDDGYYNFSITDNGYGMDEDIIIKYFLTAGALFRKSDFWRKEFLDNEGKSNVQRSGRFGVGVLASFLLGDEMEVTTRRHEMDYALTFKASIYDEQIEIIKTKGEIGTNIKIRLNKHAVEKLFGQTSATPRKDVKWYNWFIHDLPKLNITYQGNRVNLTKQKAPSIWSYEKWDWRSFAPEGFNLVTWKYPENNYDWSLACNGIIIPDGYKFHDNYISTKPVVSIIDFDGNLPISLDRNKIEYSSLPFQNELIVEICKDIISCILMDDVAECNGENLIIKKLELNHPAIPHRTHALSYDNKYIFMRNGFSFFHRYFLNDVIHKKLNIMVINDNLPYQFNLKYRIDPLIIVTNVLKTSSDVIYIGADKDWIYHHNFEAANNTRIKFYSNYRRLYIRDIEENMSKKRLQKIKEFIPEPKLRGKKNKEISIFADRNIPASDFDLNFFKTVPFKLMMIIENYFRFYHVRYDSVFKETMMLMFHKYFQGKHVIPYELNERKKEFQFAFSDLKNYMKFYE